MQSKDRLNTTSSDFQIIKAICYIGLRHQLRFISLRVMLMAHRLTLSQIFIDEDTSKVFLKQKLVITYLQNGFI